MADIRELLILNPRFITLDQGSAFTRLVGSIRMVVRRFVLHTAKTIGFRSLYSAAYRFHIWVARKLALRFAGTRAIYLSAGMGRGEVRPGISDIDLVIFGDWTEVTQFKLLKALAITVLVMPLFDRESLGAIQTWDDFLRINQTDLLLAYHYASAKRNWKLVWGEDLICQLPDLAVERRAGASYLEVRRWWSTFMVMATGQGITARDSVFRNSISFKAVADVLRAELMAEGKVPPRRRVDLLLEGLTGSDELLRERLLASEATTFLQMEGDPRESVTPWLLERIERFHVTLAEAESFAAVAHPQVLGEAAELIVGDATRSHVERMTEKVARLPGFRSAYLAPCAGFLCSDTLGLYFEFAPGKDPSIGVLRALLMEHFGVVKKLPQRLGIYLLLENGAYILDPIFGLEFWSTILMPQANPDLFISLSRPEFTLKGSPRPPHPDVRWSRVSQELLDEELIARRGAHARFGVLSRPTEVENLRNLWRFLQLLVMEQRTDNTVMIPVTVPAICRAFSSIAAEVSEDLQLLDHAMRSASSGQPDAISQAMQRVYDWTKSHGFA